MTLVKLLPHQGQLVQAPFVFKEKSFFLQVAGYASGKTSGLVYAILHSVKLLLGKKDKEGHNPKILIASKNLTFMKKTLTGMLEQDLKETNSVYSYDKAHNIITIGNVELLLIPDEDESSIYGFSVCCSYTDELDELDTQTAMAVVKSINDRCRQQVEGFRTPFMVYTTSSQGLKGTYQTVMHFKKTGIGYVLMRARTKDNIYLPKDYVKNMYAIYNEKEVACYLEGQFVSVDSGLVFPDYRKEKNMLDSDLYEYVRDNIPDATIYIGQDFNSFGNNAIASTVLKGDDGTCAIVLLKDYEFPDIRRAPETFRYDFPTQKIVWIPDMTYKEHFGEFKKELRLHKITIAYRSCNPLVGDRNFACNKAFVAERLFCTPICQDTEKTLMTWQKDPKTGLPTKGNQGAPDHKGDCLGYLVHYILSWHRGMKDLYDVTLGYIYEKRRARGADARELEITTDLMTAERLKKVPLHKAVNVEYDTEEEENA